MGEKDRTIIKYTQCLHWTRYRARFFIFSNLILRTTLRQMGNYDLFPTDEEFEIQKDEQLAESYIGSKWWDLAISLIIFKDYSHGK